MIRYPSKRTTLKIAGALLGLIAFLYVASWSPSRRVASASGEFRVPWSVDTIMSNPDADGFYRTRGKFYVSTTRDAEDRLIAAGQTNDQHAINALVLSGRVLKLKAGINVKVVDRSDRLVKIDLKGESAEFWTVAEELE